jgi:formylglycine-generating enzyme required for sulfatase activity
VKLRMVYTRRGSSRIRVNRGSSCDDYGGDLRAAYRNGYIAVVQDCCIGARLSKRKGGKG